MSERERFQKATEGKLLCMGNPFSRLGDGSYAHTAMQLAWLAWQARADIAVAERAKLVAEVERLREMCERMARIAHDPNPGIDHAANTRRLLHEYGALPGRYLNAEQENNDET